MKDKRIRLVCRDCGYRGLSDKFYGVAWADTRKGLKFFCNKCGSNRVETPAAIPVAPSADTTGAGTTERVA